MKKNAVLAGITINVFALGLVSLFTDVSTEMTLSILPTFMKSLGLSMVSVGIIEGVAEAGANALRGFSGWFSDRIGNRKAIAMAGYGLSTVTKPLFSVAYNAEHVLALRSLDRVGKGIRTAPRDALIASSIKAGVRGKAFGLHRSLDQLGAVVGPLIAFLLLPTLGFRNVFLLTAVPGLLALFVMAIFVKDVKITRVERSYGSSMRRSVLTKDYFIFLLASALLGSALFSYTFLMFRSSALGVADEFIPLLYMLYNLAHVLASFPAGFMSDRIGVINSLLGGYFFLALTYVGFAVASNPANAIGLIAIYGVAYAIIDTLQRVFIPSLVEEGYRGTAYGIYYCVVGVATLLANIAAGYLWSMGPHAVFFYGAFLVILAFTILLRLRKVIPRMKSTH